MFDVPKFNDAILPEFSEEELDQLRRESMSNSFKDDQRRLAMTELKTVIALLLKLGVNPVEIEAVVDDELYLKGAKNGDCVH